MSFSRQHRIALTRLSIALAAALAAVPLAAQEASPDQEKKDEKTTQLERVEVTGSNIKRTDIETASPIQVVSHAEIEAMGARTLLQVLDNLPAARPAQQDSKSLYTGSDGASQANLRGIGPQATLVLLNGRRLSYYGAPEGFQTQFVNIDSIPAAAVERVEVLKDGASSVYGTDAMAGVINVITKQSYQGAELSLSSDSSSRIGSYGEQQASLTGGFGNLADDRYNVYASINLYRRDPIPLSDWYDKRPSQYYVNNPNYIKNLRLGTGSAPGVFNPGSYFAFNPIGGAKMQQPAPGCPDVLNSEAAGPRCIWQTWLNDQTSLGSSSDRATAYVHGTFQINDSLQAFAEITYTDIDLKAAGGTPRTFNSGGGLTSWYARNTGLNVNTFSYPFMGPNNVYNHASPEIKALMGGVVGLQYLLQDAGDYFGKRNTDKSYRALAGLRGNFGDWNWETALTTAGSADVAYQNVNVNLRGFEKAFGPFTIDPATGRRLMADNPAYKFGVISAENAALLREAYSTFDIKSWTRLTTWDGKVEGPLFQLPAGEARAAFGFSASREMFYTPGNADAANGLITQQGGSWFDGRRTTEAVFGETVAPVTDKIEVDGALRVDKYPNFDANVAPKIGIKFQALPELLLRGTYSEGFRAPSLAEAGTGGVFAQLGGYKDETRCNETNAIANLLLKSKRPGDVDLGTTMLNSDCSRTVARMTEPNPNLKPEKAKISTLGFVFEPTKNLSVSADYWFIYRRNEIVTPDYTRPSDIVSKTRFDLTDADRANLAQLAAMCADPASGVTCPNPMPGYSVGNVSSVTGQYKNRGRTLVDGFDIDARGRISMDRWGDLTLGVAATIARRFDTSLYDPTQGLDYGNVVGYYGTPKVRATLDANWTYGDFTTSLYVNYTGKTKWAYDITDVDSLPGKCMTAAGVPPAPQNCNGVPAWWTANLGLTWKPTDKITAGFQIKNLFNRLPFYDPNSFNADASDYANLWGRVYSVSLRYKFL